ncbi:unnamed protein product [Schistosoma intercalatum]|nr:unnamed protein product [Schistosoma intercalatum]
MHLTEEDENNIQIINEFKVTWFTLLSRVDAAPTVDEIVLTSLNHVANLIMCRRSGNPSKSIVFDMALNLCVFETLFQWNFVFTGADLEAYKVRELQFYDSLIGSNGDYYLSHEAFVIPFMATMHHCSLRSCLLVERALVRLLNTVCAILSTQFKHEYVQDNSLSSSSPTSCLPLHHKQHNDNKNSDSLHLFRRMCMGVVDLSQIGTSFTSDLNHTTNNNNSNNDSSNVNCERCNSITSGGLISSLKIMESIDWAMCLESSKFDMDNEFDNHNNNDDNNVFQSDFDESPSYYTTNNISSNNKLPTIDSICDLLAPYVFRDGDLGWQARDSLLLIAAYSLRDEEFSHSIAKYSSICAVIATGLGILYTALPHRLVNNNSPETWPLLIRTLNTNQLANARFNEFLDALDFCRSLLEIAHPLIQSCLLHCIHAIFFVSIIGPALTQKAPEDVITATVYLEQFIIHTVGSSLLPILLRFLLMKLPSTIIFDTNSQMNQMTTSTSTTPEGINSIGSCQSSSVEATLKDDDNNSPVFSPESCDGPSLFGENQFITSNSITYMDLIIARIHQCNSLLGITTMSLMNTIIDLHCEDIMFVLVLKHLISVRDHLFNIGWTWPDPSSVTDASTKLLNLSSSSSSLRFNLDSARFNATRDESIIHHSNSYHYHQHEQNRQRQPNHRNNTVAQLDIDNVEEFNYSSDQSLSKELHNKDEGLEVLASKNEPFVMQINNLPVGSQFLASHLLIPHAELTANSSLIFNNYYQNDFQLTNKQDCNKHTSLHINNNNNTTVNINNELTQQTSLTELSSNHSSPTPPSSISSMYNNDTTMNSSNSMLDWLSYTSWAHQTIKIRKHACKTWQLTFDANQPTNEQINLLNENLKNLQMTEKESTTHYEKTRKFSEYDCRIGLDPYKIYTEYKCFINRNCYTNRDLEINANELHAKALCNAATKLNIDTDLDLDGSENLDDCPPVAESDQYTDQSKQKQQTYHEKLFSNQQIHKSVSVRNPICMSHSIDHNLCTCFKKPKESFENSTETSIHTKLYDKSLIKSWYYLNFLDSFDINEQVNVHNPFNNVIDTTNIEENSKIKQEETHPQSLVGGPSEYPEQTLHNEEYITSFMNSNSNNNCYYSEDKSCELNKFIKKLENFSPEHLMTNFNILDERQEQLKFDKKYFRNTNNIGRCNSLSSLHNFVDESCQYFDKLFGRLKAPSLQILPNQVNNHELELFDIPLTETYPMCTPQKSTSAYSTKGFSDLQLDKSCNKITQRAKSLTRDELHSNTTTTTTTNNNHNRDRHHHQHRDNYCEMGFNHGSLNNLIQTRLMNDSNSHDNFNSPCSLVLMSSTDTKEKVKEMNRDYLINYNQCHLSPSRVQMNCPYKKSSISTISSTTSGVYLETIRPNLSQNPYNNKSLGYNDIDLNVDHNNNNNTGTNTTDFNTTHKNSMDSCTNYPNLGPFLTTLFNRLENFTNNCFYANLYLTNLISSLASYPIPLLRAILFLTNTTQFAQSMAAATTNSEHFNTQTFRAINDNVLYYLPYNILCLIKEQIELFTVLYTRQVKYFGSLDTLNGYSFDELKQEARRYLNCETIDLSKLSISMDTSTIPLGVEKKKKKLKSTNISHKESKTFTTDKQNISPMMNSNRRSYFRKWFSLSSKSNNNNNKNSDIINTSGNNLKNTKSTIKNRLKSSNTNVLNPKDLLDFSQILQKPMTEFTFLIDLDSNYQQLINILSDQEATTIRGSSSSNGNNAQKRRRSFRLSTIKRLKTNVNTEDRIMSMMMMNTENSILDISRIQRMVLCAVIFEDFCKELAAICTEHSVQW